PGKINSVNDVARRILARDAYMAGNAFLGQGIAVMLLASLVVGIRASGTVSGEREGQTWEALLLTPLQTRELVRGKLSGIFAASVPYLIAYAIPALVISGLAGFLAVFWTVLWLGVTALAMYYVGAAGLWCSVSSRSSWRSLLGTLGFGYVGGFLICSVIASVPVMILTCIIWVILQLLDAFYGTATVQSVGGFDNVYLALLIASCVGLAGVCFAAAHWRLLNWAEQWVALRERVRFWKDEPHRVPRRRLASSRPHR